MSRRIPSLIIKDILTCIEHLHDYTADLSFDDFASNFMVVEACLYNIQIIGEAAGQTSRGR
ncbi:MAG: HepT-like ribonuclease domain-containing protein [Cyclobacteriaceae bacterium]